METSARIILDREKAGVREASSGMQEPAEKPPSLHYVSSLIQCLERVNYIVGENLTKEFDSSGVNVVFGVLWIPLNVDTPV